MDGPTRPTLLFSIIRKKILASKHWLFWRSDLREIYRRKADTNKFCRVHSARSENRRPQSRSRATLNCTDSCEIDSDHPPPKTFSAPTVNTPRCQSIWSTPNLKLNLPWKSRSSGSQFTERNSHVDTSTLSFSGNLGRKNGSIGIVPPVVVVPYAQLRAAVTLIGRLRVYLYRRFAMRDIVKPDQILCRIAKKGTFVLFRLAFTADASENESAHWAGISYATSKLQGFDAVVAIQKGNVS
jgi:hypothetical protein